MKVIIVKMYTEIISGAGEKSVSYQVHSNRKTICWCSSPTHLVQSSKAWELGKYNLLDPTYAFSKPQLIFTLDTIRYKFPPQKFRFPSRPNESNVSFSFTESKVHPLNLCLTAQVKNEVVSEYESDLTISIMASEIGKAFAWLSNLYLSKIGFKKK